MVDEATALDTFLPARLAGRVASTDRPLKVGTAERLRGAALFVDIQGYTPLTERLCSEGPHGVERLKRLVSRAFAGYIETITACGGEVALFAGDAILACWPDEGLERAIACAERLSASSVDVASLEAGDPGSSSGSRQLDPLASPQLRIGVARGELWIAAVGPEDTPELLIAGGAVLDAMDAKRRAAPGSFALAAPPEDMESTAQTSRPAEISSAGVGRVLAHLVHPAVRAALRDGVDDLAWLAERRNIVPLFARFDVGELRDPVAPLARAQELAVAIRSAASGTVGAGGRLLVDDNGLIFLNVFGTPNTTRGRELDRALELAWSLRAVGRNLGVPCSVGVAGGDAFCGPLGTPARREYVAIGRPMNLAARLMAAAPDGEVWVDDGLRARAGRWTLRAGIATRFKGIETPVTPAVLVGPMAERRTLLIGRDRELERLESLLARADEAPGVVVLIGQAGLGKSALLEALARRARARAVTVVSGGAGVPDSAVAYAGLRPLLRGAFGLGRHASPREVKAAVHARLAGHPDRAPLAALLSGPLSVDLPESEESRSLRGQDRAEATLRLLTAVVGESLASRTGGETLVVVEDLHWVDSASVRLMAQLLRAFDGLRVVATSRPTPASQQSGLLSVLPIAGTVNLGPLHDDDVATLLAAELGGPLDDPELATAIARRTGGNPLMCREYALSLEDRNALERGPRGFRRRPGSDVLTALPDGVSALIASRIDRLAPLGQRALKTAAVLGPAVSFSLLVDVVDDITTVELEDTLTELASHRLLEHDDADIWSFDHASIRDAAYELLLFEQRAKIHRKAASLLTRARSDGVTRYGDVAAAELVRHWAGAGDDGQTLAWADVAADEAIDAGAWREAVALLGRCVALTAEHGDPATQVRRVRWLRKLSEAHGELGHTGERRRYAHDALSLAEMRAGAGGQRRFAARLRDAVATGRLVSTYALRPGRTLTHRPHQPAASPKQRALDEEATMHVEFARAHNQVATVAYFDGDGVKLLTETLAAIEHADAASLTGDLIRRYAQLGGVLGIGGLAGLAERHLDHAIAMARESRDQSALVYSCMVRALYSAGRADWHELEHAADEGQEAAQRLQLWNDWGNIQIVRAWMHFYRGEFDALELVASELLRRALDTGNEQQESWSRRALGNHRLHLGDAAGAVDELERAVVAPERDGVSAEIFECAGCLALALGRAGRHAEALEQAHRAVALAGEVGAPTVHVQSIGATSLVRLIHEMRSPERGDLGRRDAWRELQAPAMAYLKRCARTFPVARPLYEQMRAESLALRGRERAARKARRAAEKLATQLGVAAWP